MTKFSVTIMNPPYGRNFHLDIIENVIPFSEEVVNISPTGWLKDIVATENLKCTTLQRYEDSIATHIKDVHEIDAKRANEEFSIGSFESVDIISLDNNIHDTYKQMPYIDGKKSKDIFEKVIMKVYNGEVDNIANNIQISTIHGHPGLRDEFDIISPQYHIAIKRKPSKMPENEFLNWHKSCATVFMKYCNLLTRQGQHLQPKLLPYMEDYSHEWTDEDFFKFFNLTHEEQEKIMKVMEKYA